MSITLNYLLAIADLMEYRKTEITIPVYLADSVRTPAEGEDVFTYDSMQFHTAVGTFLVPKAVATKEHFNRFCDILEISVRTGISSEAFIRQVQVFAPDVNKDRLRDLYGHLVDLHHRGLNGLWARLLKNNFAPLVVGQFDYIVGNPPWVNWENLPEMYRKESLQLWHRYGLMPPRGMAAMMGSSKMDIAMLMTYVVADLLLKPGGQIGFVITQTVFKTAGAGQSFRRFSIPKVHSKPVPLRVVHVDDMVALKPFEGASNRTAVVILVKGKPTRYPVSYTLWLKNLKRGARFTYDSDLDEVIRATQCVQLIAEPVDPGDPTSPWLTARPKVVKAIRKVLGLSDYTAHEGANTGGANGVYWVEVVYERPDGRMVVRNLVEEAKIKVDDVTEAIEPDLLYPLLRGRDVRRWHAEASAQILVPKYPGSREKAISEREMQIKYPATYGYLMRFRSNLLQRKDAVLRRALKAGAPFYAIGAVGDYTFAPWKVVWREVANTVEAAVVGPHDGKATIPAHTLIFVACTSKEEAYYLCAALNSTPVRMGVYAYIALHPDTHILDYFRIPRFNAADPVHGKLVELSWEAHRLAGGEDGEALREIESEIDRSAAELWGLTPGELREIQQNLAELQRAEG